MINQKTARLKYSIIDSHRPGPRIFLLAGQHGDEPVGVKAAEMMTKKLKGNLLKGTVLILPKANPDGLKHHLRNFKGKDLNRSYFIKSKNTPAQQTAKAIFKLVKNFKPDLVLDLHDDWPDSLAYLLIDPKPHFVNQKQYRQLVAIAKSAGELVIQETDKVSEVKRTAKSFSGFLIKNGFLALTLETGTQERPKFHHHEVHKSYQMVWHILNYLKMVNRPNYSQLKKFQRNILQYSDEPKSPKLGKIKIFVKGGDVIKKKQPLAEISGTIMFAKNSGIILGVTDKKNVKKKEMVIASGLF
jgi:predicted deacylase